MDRGPFLSFLRIANTTRTALGLRALHWPAPEPKVITRHLPAKWQTDLVRHALKHRWFATLRRWELADELRLRGAPLVEEHTSPIIYTEQVRLICNYQLYDAACTATHNVVPSAIDLSSETVGSLNNKGYRLVDMQRGSYPDGTDIRDAFHLCLATTGWNPAVLLSLNVDEPFIESHPKDAGRYVLRGTKARAGGTEQSSEGLFKSQGSAGSILKILMARTSPLREQLRRTRLEYQVQIEEATAEQLCSLNDLAALRLRVAYLEQGIRSPWLYVSRARRGKINWLNDYNYSHTSQAKRSHLHELISGINSHQPSDHQVSLITSSDLRDAYAANIYRISGGSVLAVMKALGHRNVNSTVGYLSNTLLKAEHRKLFSTFSSALWHEINTHARVDPTILAKWSRDGEMSSEQSERLRDYRALLRSRIGVACKDPFHPPKHLAPKFKADGESMCSVQRCTLCVENAVILPESLPGLCKRMAELRFLRTAMAISAFQESSFVREMTNTEIILLAFDQKIVAQHLNDWESRIANGTHRVAIFDGIEPGDL